MLTARPPDPNLRVRSGWVVLVVVAMAFGASGTSVGIHAASATAAQPTVGAIRWDAWFTGGPGSSDEIALTPPQWHDRLPFYTTFGDTGAVQIRLDSQGLMDQEIAYAHAGGLDYWAFDYYGDANPISNALEKYLASTHKNEMKFSLVVLPQAVQAADWPGAAVAHLRDPQYQTVLGGRPLVYAFAAGSPITRADMDGLRVAVRAAGLPDPYIVWMTWDVNDGKTAALGLDAVSAYAHAPTGPIDSVQPYANLASVDRASWDAAAAQGLKAVPLATSGWDPRPRYAHPPPWGVGNHTAVAAGTAVQVADHLREAMDWGLIHAGTAEAGTVIVYAWNEFAEGGWLTPLLGSGSERLDAIAAAIAGGPRVDLSPPRVSLAAPAADAVVSGNATIQAEAADDRGVAGVQFGLDGLDLGVEDVTAPYALTWDTGTVLVGPHVLSATARDAAGNATTSRTVSITVSNQQPAQPVGLWHLNEGTGISTFDLSGNGVNGARSGGSAWVAGRRGNAVGLDGVDGSVTIPDAPHLDGMKALTLSAWIRLAQRPMQNAVVAGKDSNGQSYRITIGSTGSASFTVHTSDNAWYGAGTVATSRTSLQPDTWYHLTGTYDGSRVRIYVNGALEGAGDASVSGVIVDSSSPLRLGYKSSTNIDYLKGIVDEVSIYSVALDPAQVRAMYDAIELPDTASPMVSLISPSAAAKVSGKVTLSATAVDESAIARVEFYVDGQVKGSDTTAPYSLKWDAGAYPNGSGHTLSVRAFDSANNVGNSGTIGVTVLDTRTPSVAITAPAGGAQVTHGSTITVQASASDVSGIAKVAFLVNGTLACTDSSAPYACAWVVPGPTGVTYTLKANAYDTAGNTASSTISVSSK